MDQKTKVTWEYFIVLSNGEEIFRPSFMHCYEWMDLIRSCWFTWKIPRIKLHNYTTNNFAMNIFSFKHIRYFPLFIVAFFIQLLSRMNVPSARIHVEWCVWCVSQISQLTIWLYYYYCSCYKWIITVILLISFETAYKPRKYIKSLSSVNNGPTSNWLLSIIWLLINYFVIYWLNVKRDWKLWSE